MCACEKGEKAVAVVKLMPSRPESTNVFCEQVAVVVEVQSPEVGRTTAEARRRAGRKG